MKKILDEIQQKTKKRIPAYKIKRIIGAMIESDNFWEIVDLSEQPLFLVNTVVDLFISKKFAELKNNNIILTKKGNNLVKRLAIKSIIRLRCSKCKGRGINISSLRKPYKKFLHIIKNRPPAIQKFDQGFQTPDSVFGRIALAIERGDIQGKNIIILGDDDLMAIALKFTNLPAKVTILEIDTRITRFIEKINSKYNLDIEIVNFDLCKKLPQKFIGKYDTFFCDPTEAFEGFKIFIAKGIATLKKEGCAGYFGITRTESSIEKWWKFEKFLLNAKVVITDIISNFSEYENWDFTELKKTWESLPVKQLPDRIWYRSWLFRVETLPGFLKINKEIKSKDLYEDGESFCR